MLDSKECCSPLQTDWIIGGRVYCWCYCTRNFIFIVIFVCLIVLANIFLVHFIANLYLFDIVRCWFWIVEMLANRKRIIYNSCPVDDNDWERVRQVQKYIALDLWSEHTNTCKQPRQKNSIRILIEICISVCGINLTTSEIK